jgi:hypothetical protein
MLVFREPSLDRSPMPVLEGFKSIFLGKPGHSGYPIFSGRVIQNSGNENCYPILVPKKHYPQFRVPANSGSGIPDLPEFSKNNTLYKISIAIYI